MQFAHIQWPQLLDFIPTSTSLPQQPQMSEENQPITKNPLLLKLFEIAHNLYALERELF